MVVWRSHDKSDDMKNNIHHANEDPSYANYSNCKNKEEFEKLLETTFSG